MIIGKMEIVVELQFPDVQTQYEHCTTSDTHLQSHCAYEQVFLPVMWIPVSAKMRHQQATKGRKRRSVARYTVQHTIHK